MKHIQKSTHDIVMYNIDVNNIDGFLANLSIYALILQCMPFKFLKKKKKSKNHVPVWFQTKIWIY